MCGCSHFTLAAMIAQGVIAGSSNRIQLHIGLNGHLFMQQMLAGVPVNQTGALARDFVPVRQLVGVAGTGPVYTHDKGADPAFAF